jgi:hypothetical protein
MCSGTGVYRLYCRVNCTFDLVEVYASDKQSLNMPHANGCMHFKRSCNHPAVHPERPTSTSAHGLNCTDESSPNATARLSQFQAWEFSESAT